MEFSKWKIFEGIALIQIMNIENRSTLAKLTFYVTIHRRKFYAQCSAIAINLKVINTSSHIHHLPICFLFFLNQMDAKSAATIALQPLYVYAFHKIRGRRKKWLKNNCDGRRRKTIIKRTNNECLISVHKTFSFSFQQFKWINAVKFVLTKRVWWMLDCLSVGKHTILHIKYKCTTINIVQWFQNHQCLGVHLSTTYIRFVKNATSTENAFINRSFLHDNNKMMKANPQNENTINPH